jgi:hypothetical protein
MDAWCAGVLPFDAGRLPIAGPFMRRSSPQGVSIGATVLFPCLEMIWLQILIKTVFPLFPCALLPALLPSLWPGHPLSVLLQRIDVSRAPDEVRHRLLPLTPCHRGANPVCLRLGLLQVHG